MNHIYFKKNNININKIKNDFPKIINHISDPRASKIIQKILYKPKKDLLNIKNYMYVCESKYKLKWISNNIGNEIKKIISHKDEVIGLNGDPNGDDPNGFNWLDYLVMFTGSFLFIKCIK